MVQAAESATERWTGLGVGMSKVSVSFLRQSAGFHGRRPRFMVRW
jgi:hypothetical protein